MMLFCRDALESSAVSHALASLVRVASSYRPRPSRTTASSVAPVRRTKMDVGHHQRFGAAMGLSAGSNRREGSLVRSPQSAAPITDFASPRRHYEIAEAIGGPSPAPGSSSDMGRLNETLHEARHCLVFRIYKCLMRSACTSTQLNSNSQGSSTLVSLEHHGCGELFESKEAKARSALKSRTRRSSDSCRSRMASWKCPP